MKTQDDLAVSGSDYAHAAGISAAARGHATGHATGHAPGHGRGETHVADAPAGDVDIVVIAQERQFCTPLLRSVELEFRHSVLRHDRLDELAGHAARGGRKPRLFIVDEAEARDLLERPRAYLDAAGGAQLALGYRDAGLARKVHEVWPEISPAPIGFLPMRLPLDMWLSTLRLLLDGQISVPMDIVSPPCAAGRPGARPGNGAVAADPRFKTLTRREREVLSLLTEGQSNKQIAASLAITEHTVKLHVHNAVTKIGVANRTAAATAWLQAAGAPAG